MNDQSKAKVTAWALNELSADEKRRIEDEIDACPEARSYATETREFCSLLRSALAAPAEAGLTDQQRARLTQKLADAQPDEAKIVRFRVRRLVWPLTAAAAVLVAAMMLSQWLPRPMQRRVADGASTATEGRANDQRLAEANAWFGGKVEADIALQDSASPAPGQNDGLAEWERRDGAASAGNRTTLTSRAPDSSKTPGDTLWSAYDTDSRFGESLLGQASAAATESKVASADIARPTGATPLADLAFETPALRPDAGNGPAEIPNEFSLGLRELGRDPGGSETRGLQSDQDAGKPAVVASSSPSKEKKKDAVASESELERAKAANGPPPAEPLLAARGARARVARGAAPEQAVPAPASAPAAPSAALAKSRSGEAEFVPDEPARKSEALSAGIAGDAGIASNSDRRRITLGNLSVVPAKPSGGAVAGDALKLVEEQDAAGKEFYFRYFVAPKSEPSNEAYAEAPENPFKSVAAEPLSTFSIDVDTASYANVRRFLNQGQRPPREAVRIEEMVNYFSYDYPQPDGARPFSVTVDLSECPWQPAHRLARIGLKGRGIPDDKRPTSNLVFLVDVSGSMQEPNKLPLVKQSLRLLVERLTENDRVAMVTYAGNSGLALNSTTGDKKQQILQVIDALEAGGSTHGSAGLKQAYEVAVGHFIKGGVNRVILATDGDFNVGITDREELMKMITDKAKSGVFLSVLGYGMGNLKDATMETLADKGNGNYAYIDGLGEARKVLAEEMNATLITIAKDVKIQIEFNPGLVRSYRLLGYENRLLAKEDFNDDKKDAGEIGAGHTVTALYELVPVGAPPEIATVDALKYQPPAPAPPPTELKLNSAHAGETMTVKLRYKAPEGDKSELLEVPVVDKEAKFAEAPADFKFAASVAAFGILLKDSAHKGSANWELVRKLALEGKGRDELGYRGEFIQLVDKAQGVVR